MSDTIIKVENVGKQYLIGHNRPKGYTALRDVIAQKAKGVGKTIHQTLRGKQLMEARETEAFWALKDISFDISKGEAVGIIGRNGAGKSTLLKVLSRITEPTRGRITLNGRVASLLEVGTGFHPELTGRENIFLNGAILGMNRAEIKSKFDEIVDFSGVARFLDTPVKRYSSGMYVRLAFSVAAHLEPEILIIDEVLAVGDAEFQKKCLGKMEGVSKSGRTVLFVSHDMVAIRTLCTNCILLDSGNVVVKSDVETVIQTYLQKDTDDNTEVSFHAGIGGRLVKLMAAKITDSQQPANKVFTVNTDLKVSVTVECAQAIRFNVSAFLYKSSGECIFNTISPITDIATGTHAYEFIIPGSFLNDGNYYLSFFLVKDGTEVLFTRDEVLSFEIKDSVRDGFWNGKWAGAVRPSLQWKIN